MRSLLTLGIVAVILFSMTMPASAGKSQDAWFIDVQVTDVNRNSIGTTIVGASDDPGDVDFLAVDQNYVGLHVGIGPSGENWWDVISGSRTKLVRDIYIWSNDLTTKAAYVHWFTIASDYRNDILYSRTMWPHVLYSLKLYGSNGVNLWNGSFSKANEKWIPINPSQGVQRLRIDCNPPRN